MTFALKHHRPIITWKAIYEDNTEVSQFQSDGLEISSDSISRDRVKSMSLYKSGILIVTLDIGSGQRLIYRRRTEKIANKVKEVCHILGWRKRSFGVLTGQILFYFESDGRIEETNGFKEKHLWHYSPTFRKFEEV